MFRCYFCKQVTPPKTTRHTVIIETREKQYSTRRRESKGGPRRGFRGRDEPPQDRGGKGIEISKEVPACPACAAKHHDVTVISSTPAPAAVADTPMVVADTAEAVADTVAPGTDNRDQNQ